MTPTRRVSRRRDPDLAPDLLLLLGDEVQEIAMQRQHRHGDIFDHAPRRCRAPACGRAECAAELSRSRTDRRPRRPRRRVRDWERSSRCRPAAPTPRDSGPRRDRRCRARAGTADRARAPRRSSPIPRRAPCWPCREPSCRRPSERADRRKPAGRRSGACGCRPPDRPAASSPVTMSAASLPAAGPMPKPWPLKPVARKKPGSASTGEITGMVSGV